MTDSVINKEKMNREVYCFTCKVYSITEDIDVCCETCGNRLITVVYSPLSNRMITGAKA